MFTIPKQVGNYQCSSLHKTKNFSLVLLFDQVVLWSFPRPLKAWFANKLESPLYPLQGVRQKMRLSQNTLCTLPKWGWVTSSSSPSPKAILCYFQSHLSLDSGMGLEPPNDSKVDSRTCPTTPLTTHISRRPPLSRTQSGTTVYVTKHPRPQRFAWLIEPISIHEWEWELIHYFLQWMGMGTYSSFFMNGPKSGLTFRFVAKM